MSTSPLVILFATVRYRPTRARTIARVAWRRPVRLYNRLLVYLIQRLTRSRLVHIMVCYDGACLNPRRLGNQIGPSDPVIHHYPGLTRAFIVPAKPVDLDRHLTNRREPVLPTIVSWLTGGRWPRTCNCVACAVECLGQAGVIVPRWVTTPQRLHDWLMEAGYGFEDLE